MFPEYVCVCVCVCVCVLGCLCLISMRYLPSVFEGQRATFSWAWSKSVATAQQMVWCNTGQSPQRLRDFGYQTPWPFGDVDLSLWGPARKARGNAGWLQRSELNFIRTVESWFARGSIALASYVGFRKKPSDSELLWPQTMGQLAVPQIWSKLHDFF